MITNFNKHTEDLTEQEFEYAETIMGYLKRHLTGNTLKQNDLVDILNMRFVNDYGPGEFQITSARLRKYFNYFRVNGLLPLIATSEGCYISEDPVEIEKQIKSLEERARQIMRAADGMKILLTTKTKQCHQNQPTLQTVPTSP